MSTLKSIVVWVLTCEARLLLARLRPKVIAVTGSVGKTTTKDAVYSALSGTLRVRKSVKSFNSDIGVPLTILGLANPAKNPFVWLMALTAGLFRAVATRTYPEWLGLEIGAERPGGIRRLARGRRPATVWESRMILRRRTRPFSTRRACLEACNFELITRDRRCRLWSEARSVCHGCMQQPLRLPLRPHAEWISSQRDKASRSGSRRRVACAFSLQSRGQSSSMIRIIRRPQQHSRRSIRFAPWRQGAESRCSEICSSSGA